MAGSPYDFELQNGRCVVLPLPSAALRKKLNSDPWGPETMLGAAKLLLDKGETREEFEDVVAICRQCIMQQESVPPQQYRTKTRKTMAELACAPICRFTRFECEESILPLRIALEYQPKDSECLHELGLRLNCLSRHTWDSQRAQSLVRERDEVMEKAASGGYGPAIVERYIRAHGQATVAAGRTGIADAHRVSTLR